MFLKNGMIYHEDPEQLHINTEADHAYFIPFAKGEDPFKGRESSSYFELLNGEWKKGWHAFCETVRTRYTDAVKNAFNDDSSYTDNALFSHYLDCEAHTDVWRELFPTANKTNCISEKAE